MGLSIKMAAEKRSVLFVCLGNICRSPIAEAVFAHLVKQRGEEGKWHIDSAGTAEYHIGCKPDRRGLACLKSHGIETPHRARVAHEDDFREFDFIFGMDDDNIDDLKDIQPRDGKAKLEKLTKYDVKGKTYVPDPYYGGDDGFEPVYQQCLRCCEEFLKQHG